MPTGYYDQDFEPWIRGMRGLGSMIARQPLLNAQASDRTQRNLLTAEQTKTERAQGANYEAETAELLQKGRLVKAIEDSSAQAQQDILAGITDSEAVRTFTAASSALTGVNKDDIAMNMKKGLGTLLARQGNIKTAASIEDPNAAFKTEADNTSRETIASNRPLNVGAGGAVWQNGEVKYHNPIAAADNFETVVEEYPAEPGEAEIPEKRGFFGGVKQPYKPAVPGKPARKVTTRRSLGAAVKNDSVPFGDQTMEADEEMPANPEEPAPAVDTSKPRLSSARPITAQDRAKVMTPAIAAKYLERYPTRKLAEEAAIKDGYKW